MFSAPFTPSSAATILSIIASLRDYTVTSDAFDKPISSQHLLESLSDTSRAFLFQLSCTTTPPYKVNPSTLNDLLQLMISGLITAFNSGYCNPPPPSARVPDASTSPAVAASYYAPAATNVPYYDIASVLDTYIEVFQLPEHNQENPGYEVIPIRSIDDVSRLTTGIRSLHTLAARQNINVGELVQLMGEHPPKIYQGAIEHMNRFQNLLMNATYNVNDPELNKDLDKFAHISKDRKYPSISGAGPSPPSNTGAKGKGKRKK